MRVTRQRPEGRSKSFVVLLLAVTAAVGSSLASCSSDIAIGVQDPTPDSSVADSPSASDAGPDQLEAAAAQDGRAFDGGPPPIVCGSGPCAKSLTTLSAYGYFEGFCALLEDGTVTCWGDNGYGWLGRGEDAAASSPTAARVVGLSDVTQLAHTCALDKSGAIWCWGRGAHLQDDAGDVTEDHLPVKLPLSAATGLGIGHDIGCALVDGHVHCWGSNSQAQLAPFDSTPSWVTLGPQEIAIPVGAPIQTIVIGTATFVLRADGTVLSWGANPPLARVSSLMPDPFPKPIELGAITSLDVVVAGNTCATSAGTGYCWGQSLPGAGLLDRALPEPVVTPEPIVRISTSGALRWCAVGASGVVYCWGNNQSGQAGDGTKEHATKAVAVQGLPAPAADVRTTPEATCALLTNGKVYCWGSNYFGQLGNGKLTVPGLAPQEVVLP